VRLDILCGQHACVRASQLPNLLWSDFTQFPRGAVNGEKYAGRARERNGNWRFGLGGMERIMNDDLAPAEEMGVQ
jgi:hypothetical protein